MPHRDPLAAAQERIRALEDRVDELQSEKDDAKPPAEKRSSGEKTNQVKDVSSAEDPGKAMRALVNDALSSHPTTKDALVTVLGGLAVGLVAMGATVYAFATIDAARRIAHKPALLDQPQVFLATLVAVVLLSIALPRVVHPAPFGRTRSEDRMTYSPGVRLGRPAWAAIAFVAVVIDVLAFVLGG
jgi:hypothetical protein